MNEALPRMVTLREAAKMTGLSYDCLRKLCYRNEIEHMRTGTKYMITLDKLSDYLNNVGENL